MNKQPYYPPPQPLPPANPEHLQILKQGVEVWNEWRSTHPEIQPSISDANLISAHLCRMNLRDAILINADLIEANLQEANLRQALLARANLYFADLRSADLSGALLTDTNLRGVNLRGAKVSQAIVNGTNFANIDLREVEGLESIIHNGPSEISIRTLYRSEGQIPEVFLRGCGLSDWQIESAKLHQTELSNEEITDILYRVHDLRAQQGIQINPLFFSYNHIDSPFVDKMERHLNKKGIRFWRDIHHATSGRLERQIDRAIRLNPTVLLILSEHSVESDWVQYEAYLARRLELERKRDVLCPVALDHSWKDCRWPERLREQIMEYNILDFSDWEDDETFHRMFNRLIEGLDLFYK